MAKFRQQRAFQRAALWCHAAGPKGIACSSQLSPSLVGLSLLGPPLFRINDGGTLRQLMKNSPGLILKKVIDSSGGLHEIDILYTNYNPKACKINQLKPLSPRALARHWNEAKYPQGGRQSKWHAICHLNCLMCYISTPQLLFTHETPGRGLGLTATASMSEHFLHFLLLLNPFSC